ncbi:MAG: cytochrome c-type biogenesis protein CcmH [Candidatus Puniceispirillaceae bacterium]
MTKLVVVLALLMGLSGAFSPQASLAISPEEQLSDPQLEQRARALSAQLRCLVCQNQSIEESDADLAVDLRKEVRTQLQNGLSDKIILDNLQQTYGDYILLNPPKRLGTLILWGAPVAFVIIALLLFVQSRRLVNHDMPQDNMTQQASVDEANETVAPISRPVVIMMVVIISLATISVYALLGRPELSSRPLSDRTAERQQMQQADISRKEQLEADLASAIKAVAQTPDSIEAQLTLALIYAQTDQFDKEIETLRKALSLSNGAPAIKSLLAEALSRQAGGQIILPARALIEEVRRLVPDEPRALFMAGLAAYQDGDYQKAVSLWSRLAQTAPSASPWPDLAQTNIRLAAQEGGLELPDELDSDLADSIINAEEEDQQAMIAAMVDSLEARLQEQGDDIEGWQRLIQARRVLGDATGLFRALEGAAANQADDRNAQLDVLEAALSDGFINDTLKGADKALMRLYKIDPQALEYLFFAGYIARAKGDRDKAVSLWQSLKEALPDDSAFKAELDSQIKALGVTD